MNRLSRLGAIRLNGAIPILGCIPSVFRIIVFEQRCMAVSCFTRPSLPIDPRTDGEYGSDRYSQGESVESLAGIESDDPLTTGLKNVFQGPHMMQVRKISQRERRWLSGQLGRSLAGQELREPRGPAVSEGAASAPSK